MASGWTNKGAYHIAGLAFRNATEPTYYYVALCTSDDTPTVDTNTVSDLTEVSAGNGYTSGGVQITRDATGFDTYTEDDTNDLAYVQLKDVSWTASGGNITGARWAIFTDDNATVADRIVIAWWDLGTDITVENGVTYTLEDLELDLPTA